jgi:hypothetical protein
MLIILCVLNSCIFIALRINIKFLKPEYNTAQNPTALMTGRVHSDETRKKKCLMLRKEKIIITLDIIITKKLEKKKMSDARKEKLIARKVNKKKSLSMPNSQKIEVFDL